MAMNALTDSMVELLDMKDKDLIYQIWIQHLELPSLKNASNDKVEWVWQCEKDG